MKRDLYFQLWSDLARAKSMVFLSGPRQSGKTTLARQIAEGFTHSLYFNWDLITDKKKLIANPAFFEGLDRKDTSSPLIIFDEIHKYRHWKNYLKGTYDHFSNQYKFLVLGSGRLNIFQKGGDSLAGRYFLFNLWPLTLAELANKRRPFQEFIKNPLQFTEMNSDEKNTWEQLSRLSGFPEPYFLGKETDYRRWSHSYRQQLIREDIRNMTEIKNLDAVEILFSMLPSRVGSPLSALSLARDIQVTPKAVQNWIKIFESFYLIFLVKPWTRKIARAITKERKLYLFDYAEISEPAAKFENMVALELLRAVSNWNDLGLGRFDLHYLRNREKEEVDFLISESHKPLLLIETKLADENISKNLLKFQTLLDVPAVQLVQEAEACRIMSNGSQKALIASAVRWLPFLP